VAFQVFSGSAFIKHVILHGDGQSIVMHFLLF
jgi:hypothetical protein